MPGETVAIEGSGGPVQPALTPDEQALIGRVDRFLTDGIALKHWWDETSASNGFAERFDLGRSFNRPDESYGFFDQVRLGHGRLEVMGNYQEMFYDQPRSPSPERRDAADWMREQVREFVLRYFMRVSDFRQPEAFVDPGRRGSPPFLSGLSWCARPEAGQVGFGFSQLFYKLRGTGEVGRFRSEDEHAIVDLREIGRVYEWILVKVRIFDFRFSFKPLGPDAFDMGLPLKEESYLVLSGEFIVDERGAGPGSLGEYGFGYAFIKNATEGLLAYGPGEFDAAIELITFRVSEAGEVRVRMAFVSNRPDRIANVAIDPIEWGFRFADLFSLGMTSRLFGPFRDALGRLPLRGAFDPVYTLVDLANALSGEQAAQRWCISREQLEKDFLVRHFMQHYQAIVGSLLTWRQIPDWLDEARLPEWVVRGISS